MCQELYVCSWNLMYVHLQQTQPYRGSFDTWIWQPENYIRRPITQEVNGRVGRRMTTWLQDLCSLYYMIPPLMPFPVQRKLCTSYPKKAVLFILHIPTSCLPHLALRTKDKWKSRRRKVNRRTPVQIQLILTCVGPFIPGFCSVNKQLALETHTVETIVNR